MSVYLDLSRPESLRLIDQTGVKQYVFPSPSTHPACWDAITLPDGRILLSLCSELTTGEYAKLFIYDPEKNDAQECAYLKTSQFLSERFIRPSKVHTSMSRMPDGRIIMVTHTTDKAPQHPAWMPIAYYHDPWEGFPGSSMLIFDPGSGKLEDLGIPVPRETLYGGVYNPANGRYYALGFVKGELYEIDPVLHTVRNHGQATEWGSYRLVIGSDDNVYFTTRNGLLQRFNIRTGRIERMDWQMPCIREPGRLPPYFSYALNGPDGRLYMAGMSDMRLSALDPKTGRVEILGSFLDESSYSTESGAHPYIGCMGFDRYGELWACVCTVRKKGAEDYKLPALLVRWDVLRGENPTVLGIAGTPARVITTVCTMLMDHENDRMFLFGSNHGCDGPDVNRIDLPLLRANADRRGPVAQDAIVRPGNTEYQEHHAVLSRGSAVRAQNGTSFCPGSCIPVRLWTEFPSDTQEDSSVRSIRFLENELEVLCAREESKQLCRFRVSPDGQILEKKSVHDASFDHVPGKTQDLPSYPGRQYLSEAAHAVELGDGKTLVATKDGLLSVVSDQGVFALGPAWINGPVRAMCADQNGTAWGVAGDDADICMVFSYDARRGLRWHGMVSVSDPERGIFRSPRLDAICVSPDGKRIVIGGGGRMGCVYIFEREDCS